MSGINTSIHKMYGMAKISLKSKWKQEKRNSNIIGLKNKRWIIIIENVIA